MPVRLASEVRCGARASFPNFCADQRPRVGVSATLLDATLDFAAPAAAAGGRPGRRRAARCGACPALRHRRHRLAASRGAGSRGVLATPWCRTSRWDPSRASSSGSPGRLAFGPSRPKSDGAPSCRPRARGASARGWRFRRSTGPCRRSPRACPPRSRRPSRRRGRRRCASGCLRVLPSSEPGARRPHPPCRPGR